MAQRVNAPVVTIPAGTPQSAPIATPLVWPDGIVRVIEMDIPPGPSGLVGFYIAHSGTQLIPETAGQFIVSDNRFFSWPVEDFPDGGKWSVVGYNLDVYPHSIQFHFLIDNLPDRVPAPVQLVPIE